MVYAAGRQFDGVAASLTCLTVQVQPDRILTNKQNRMEQTDKQAQARSLQLLAIRHTIKIVIYHQRNRQHKKSGILYTTFLHTGRQFFSALCNA